jgi:hypothetical protein
MIASSVRGLSTAPTTQTLPLGDGSGGEQDVAWPPQLFDVDDQVLEVIELLLAAVVRKKSCVDESSQAMKVRNGFWSPRMA